MASKNVGFRVFLIPKNFKSPNIKKVKFRFLVFKKFFGEILYRS